MEGNAHRISDATFSCTVSGSNLAEMGKAAYSACAAYFVDQPFQIEILDADAIQTVALQAIGYSARVRARAV